jgi:hypothetical protein
MTENTTKKSKARPNSKRDRGWEKLAARLDLIDRQPNADAANATCSGFHGASPAQLRRLYIDRVEPGTGQWAGLGQELVDNFRAAWNRAHEETRVRVQVHKLDEEDPHYLDAPRAYIALDTCSGDLWASWDQEIGSAVPADVYYGLTIRWYIPPVLTHVANEMLDLVADDAQRVVDGARHEQDASYNWHGRYTDDADEAIMDIERLLDGYIDEDNDVLWDADWDYIYPAVINEVTADMDDSAVAEWVHAVADNIVADYPTAIVDRDELIELVTSYRDELID